MRIIDADSLLESISTMSDLKMNGVTIALAVAKCVTIDAVPVVRCRECKHHHDCGTHFCDALGMDCPDDSEFFCSYGERKEGADNEP